MAGATKRESKYRRNGTHKLQTAPRVQRVRAQDEIVSLQKVLTS